MATMTIDETMELALQHYAGGRLQETEGLCRQILHTEPQHGAALASPRRARPADRSPRRGDRPDAPGDRGQSAACPSITAILSVALTARGRLDEARSACRQALALNPNLAEAHYNHGNALRDARAAWRRCGGLSPGPGDPIRLSGGA